MKIMYSSGSYCVTEKIKYSRGLHVRFIPTRDKILLTCQKSFKETGNVSDGRSKKRKRSVNIRGEGGGG